MKILFRLLLLITFLIGHSVSANPVSIAVIPADLNNVCNNYYCFPEASEEIAKDVIKYFNKCGKITSPNLYIVREKLSGMSFAIKDDLDFENLKEVSKLLDTTKLLIISSSVESDLNAKKRGLWEILEIASSFNSSYKFNLKTKAVLVDTANGIVMWQGNYTKKITDNDDNFWARNSSQAYGKLENLRLYSQTFLAKEITQNVTLRFFPKDFGSGEKITAPENTDGSFFRLNKSNPTLKKPEEEPKNDYGEIIYGI